MSATLGERTGVIVVRLWLESDGRVRARVTATDLSQADETVTAAEGSEEILGVVRDCIERFASASAG